MTHIFSITIPIFPAGVHNLPAALWPLEQAKAHGPFDVMVDCAGGYRASRCRALLAPGGRLIFTTRLRPGAEDQLVPFGPDQKEALVRTVVDSLTELSGLGLDRREAAQLAAAYADLCASYPVNGEASLRRLAEAAGLLWLDCDRRRSEAARPGVTGPTVGAAEYLFVTLGRPA